MGGMAGGAIALAIELSPEQYGLRNKANELFDESKRKYQSFFGPTDTADSVPYTVPADIPPLPQVTEPLKSESEEKQQDRVDTEPPVIMIPSTEEDEGIIEVPEIANAQKQEIETSSGAEERVDVIESVTPAAVEQLESESSAQANIQVDASRVDESMAKIEALEARISDLESQLATQKDEHQNDLASAAGAAQATLETLDRLYNERETAMSVARQSLLVTELLHNMATDSFGLSPGSLKVDFENKLDRIIESCFLPRDGNRSMVRLFLGRLLANLYSVRSGDQMVNATMPGSDSILNGTWKFLHAVHASRKAVSENNFKAAIVSLSELGNISPEAAEWVQRTRQALELWQGSDAAIASMHDELSRVL
jgi:hypothetical protein